MDTGRVQLPRLFDRLVNAGQRLFSDRTFLRRYVIVGIGNVSINFGVFWILYHFFDAWYVLASIVGFFTRFLFKFTALRFWVFNHRSRQRIGTHFVQFSLLEGVSYLAGLPLLVFLVEWVHLPPPAGVVLTIAALYLFSMSMARLIFRKDTTAG